MKSFIMAAVAAFMLVGCGGLSDSVVEGSKNVEKSVNSTKKNITKKEKKFTESKIAKELAKYVHSEKLLTHFKSAKTENLRSLQMVKDLKKLIKEDDKKMENVAIGRIRAIRNSNLTALKLANKPMARLIKLKETFKNSGKLQKKAQEDNLYIVKISARIVKFINEQLSTNENTSGKKDYFNKVMKTAQRTAEDSVNVYKVLNNEYKKSNSMDISKFLAQSNELKKERKSIDAQDKLVNKKINEVNTSYTKILSDMKEDYYIVIGAVSWDNFYDYPKEHKYTYPKSKVSYDIYQRIANGSGEVGSYSKGMFGGLKLNGMSSKDWSLLRLDPERSVAKGDDESSIWVQDAPIELFHKYVIVKNGVKTETGWKKVSEATYDKHYNDLGMSILSKPYGSFESDTITSATPAGMAFVGNKKYGEWKEERNSSGQSTGNSFWAYYGMYSFFTGGNNHYYRNDYNSYRSHRRTSPGRGYYGRTGSTRTYGTRGNSGFKRSSTTRSSMKSRMSKPGARSSTRNVRSTGRSSRGRGPGGGGK